MINPRPTPPTSPQMMMPAEPLAYAGPSARAGRRVFSVGLFLWTAAILGGWAGILIFVLPRTEQTFRDFNVPLPAATVALIRIGRFIAAGGFVILIAIPIAVGFLAGPLSPGGRRVARILLTVVMAALVVFTIIALFQPMLSLMEGMGSKTGKS